MIYLVRHADAGARTAADGDPGRPLSALGLRQAAALADNLAGAVTRILASPHRRCLDTVAALSAAAHVPVEVEPRLAEGTSPEAAARLLRTVGPGTVLCTHGDLVGALVETWTRSGVSVEGPRRWEKGSIWELRTAGGRVHTARYLPPGET